MTHIPQQYVKGSWLLLLTLPTAAQVPVRATGLPPAGI